MQILRARKDWSVGGNEEVFDEGQGGDMYTDIEAA